MLMGFNQFCVRHISESEYVAGWFPACSPTPDYTVDYILFG